jgi:hypothetical protein
MDPNQGTLVALMRDNNVEVSQSVANSISASFGTRRFQDALIDWVATDNQSLRVVETPSFRHLIECYTSKGTVPIPLPDGFASNMDT